MVSDRVRAERHPAAEERGGRGRRVLALPERRQRADLHCEGSGKLDRARSRLYRGQNLQENMRWN